MEQEGQALDYADATLRGRPRMLWFVVAAAVLIVAGMMLAHAGNVRKGDYDWRVKLGIGCVVGGIAVYSVGRWSRRPSARPVNLRLMRILVQLLIAIIVILGSIALCAAGGGLIARFIAHYYPSYYPSVFPNAVTPVEVGIATGIAQGAVAGVVLGAVIVLALAIANRWLGDRSE